jgi:CubicO group peptidase (beta-lactamase class C family)
MAPAEQVGMSKQRLERIGAVLRQEVDQGKLPGVVVMVARRGKLVYSEAIGFQDKAAGTPMSRDAIFRLYSMTKPLASVAAMVLVEEGKIQLTDPVSKFLPAFAEMKVATLRREADGRVVSELVPASRPMLVHDLLRHTAGLAYGEVTPNAVVKDAYTSAGLF